MVAVRTTTFAKAKLIEAELKGDSLSCPPPATQADGTAGSTGPSQQQERHEVEVQFNPQTLKLSYANQNAGGDQARGGPRQFVGTGTAKLAVELVFDVSRSEGNDPSVKDVRTLTGGIRYFLRPKGTAADSDDTSAEQVAPPGVCFSWGEFLFVGTMDSMEETIDLFSADGCALRATVSLSLSEQQTIEDSGSGGHDTVGTKQVRLAAEGHPLQQSLAPGGEGLRTALASEIENTRQVARGTVLRSGPPTAAALRKLGVL